MSTRIPKKMQQACDPTRFDEADFLALLAEMPGMSGAAKRLIDARLNALDADLGRRLETLAAREAERAAYESFSQFGAPSTTDDRFVVSNDGMPF